MTSAKAEGNRPHSLRCLLVVVYRWFVPILAAATVALAVVGLRTHCDPRPGWAEAIYDGVQLFALTGTACPAPTDLAPEEPTPEGDADSATSETKATAPATPIEDDAVETIRTPSTLLMAEFLAALLVFLAILRLFFLPAWIRLRLWVQAMLFRDERHILIGYGALNQEIARDLAHKGVPMTIVSREFDGAARDFAAASRAILLERDIRREGAMDGLKLARCGKIIVACGEDSLTYEIARQVGKRYNAAAGRQTATGVVDAHFSSIEMHRQLMISSDMGLGSDRQFNGFAIREETARYLVARAWLVESAVERGQDRVHVVVAGAGDMGLAVVREVLQNGCSGLLARPPLISVLDCDGDGARARLRAAMPRLFDDTIPAQDRPGFQFFSCRAEAIGFADAPGETAPVERAGAAHIPEHPDDQPAADPVTAWVFCCPEDTQNLTAAMRLETAMRRGLIPPAAIYPRQWQANVSDTAHSGLGQADPLHLVAPFGGMYDVVENLSIMDTTLRDIAREIHVEYLLAKKAKEKGSPYRNVIEAHGLPPWPEGKGPDDPAKRSEIETALKADREDFRKTWDKLDNEGRLSNLEPAKQAALRLWELGYDWKGRHVGALPNAKNVDLSEQVPGAKRAALDKSTFLFRIAEAEHRRWMIERALRGWSQTGPGKGKRSDELRLHTDFETFANLGKRKKENDVRQYDLSTVRGSIRGLALHGSPIDALYRDDAAAVEIDAVTAPLDKATRLHLHLPDRPLDEDALKASLKHIKSWLARDTSVSITLMPQSAETLGSSNASGREAVEAIRKEEARLQRRAKTAARRMGVHIRLLYPDACKLREARLGAD